LEITLEAMAPTTEYDFSTLPPDKQALYRTVQRTHIHASPDGPWFFILARSIEDRDMDRFELLGITDTSMLRPQVFALFENGEAQIGLIASERQAINAFLRSLAGEDPRYQPFADRYWAARGGSHTDGGAFRFAVEHPHEDCNASVRGVRLSSGNKYGIPVLLKSGRWHVDARQLDPQRVPVDFQYWWQARAH
jgi:hypothetical protein